MSVLKNIKQIQELTIIITPDCNLNCSYCTQKHFKYKINLEKIKESLKKIASKIALNCKIDFFGGEPTLEIDNINKLIFYIDNLIPENNFKYRVITNGLFNKKLFDNINSKLKFTFSLDILNLDKRISKSEQYFIIKNNILKSIEKKIFKSIHFIYHDKIVENYIALSNVFNIDYSQISHSLVREPSWWTKEKIKNYSKEFYYFIFFDYHYFNKNKKHLNYIEKLLLNLNKNPIGCEAGISRLSINFDGEIKQCGIIDFDLDLNRNYLEKVSDFCKDCRIKNDCLKKCPFYIINEPEKFRETFCKIYKIENLQLKRYLI